MYNIPAHLYDNQKLLHLVRTASNVAHSQQRISSLLKRSVSQWRSRLFRPSLQLAR
jgi:hypothetical protein